MINRVVFRNEMYMARRTIIAGNIGVAALMALFGGMSSMIIDSPMGDMIAQVIDFVPPALLHAFNFDVASLRTFEGWMASEPLTLFMIIVGMMAASRAAATVAREVDQGTAEAVVALPIRRSTLFLSKAACGLVIVTLGSAIALGVALLAGEIAVGVKNPGAVAALFTAGYLTALAFAGIGYAVSPWLDAERTASSVGGVLVMASFALDVVAGLNDQVAWLGYASLFRLFDVNELVAGASLPLLQTASALGLFAAGVAIGVWGFRRKDIS